MIRSGLEHTFSVDIICVCNDNHDLVNFNSRCVFRMAGRPGRVAEKTSPARGAGCCWGAGCLRGALGRIVADDEEMGICRRVAGWREWFGPRCSMCGEMGRMCGITGMSACGFRNSIRVWGSRGLQDRLGWLRRRRRRPWGNLKWSDSQYVRWCRDGDFVGWGRVLVPVSRGGGVPMRWWVVPSDWTLGASDKGAWAVVCSQSLLVIKLITILFHCLLSLYFMGLQLHLCSFQLMITQELNVYNRIKSESTTIELKLLQVTFQFQNQIWMIWCAVISECGPRVTRFGSHWDTASDQVSCVIMNLYTDRPETHLFKLAYFWYVYTDTFWFFVRASEKGA